jgi:hypothetical protein
VNDTTSKAMTREHAAAMIRAGEYLQILARRGELPLTEREFEERVSNVFATLQSKVEAANALAYAALDNKPLPVAFFQPWASAPTIRKWRFASENPLPVLQLNGKNCVRPADFFKALDQHGRVK